MGSFSFKSSGVTKVDAIANALPAALPVIGILTPLALGTTDIVVTSTNLADQLTDNLRNLILTNWGERLGFYDFGANLRPLTANLVSQDDFDSSAITAIRTAVGRWMPYIDLVDFTSTTLRSQVSSVAIIQLTITFNIPSLNVKGRALQVSLFAI
jgi:phage baseplate assembly protein W